MRRGSVRRVVLAVVFLSVALVGAPANAELRWVELTSATSPAAGVINFAVDGIDGEIFNQQGNLRAVRNELVALERKKDRPVNRRDRLVIEKDIQDMKKKILAIDSGIENMRQKNLTGGGSKYLADELSKKGPKYDPIPWTRD